MNEKNFCPGFVFVRTSARKDPDALTDMHFDVAVYDSEDVDEDTEGRLIWKLPHIIVEMKGKGSADLLARSAMQDCVYAELITWILTVRMKCTKEMRAL